MENNKIDVKARNGVIVFLIILVLILASAFVASSVYIIRCKKDAKAGEADKNNDTSVTTTQTQENSLTFSSLSGLYVGDAAKEGVVPGNTQVRLYLFEDGSFRYNNEPGLASGIIGYYTFNDNEIVLHGIVQCANDIGRTIISDSLTIKINSDKSLTDGKLSATLQKSSEGFENETNIISTQLKGALEMKVLD
ncbi:MAG: hypothetical protein IKN65_03995 [Clostridia bacterium]|nr:hypothetical protein [Clostridia bacterium]